MRLHTGLRGRIFAFFMAWAGRKHDSMLIERKKVLFKDIQGTVLEIGPGTGANLAHLPRTIRYIGIEPNPHMHPHLRKRAARYGIELDLRSGLAERVDMADGSVDTVISTLVLCSVVNLAGTLGEVMRVLRPGGRFIFLEHVAAPPGTWTRHVQRCVRPVWQSVSGGCQPDRDIATALHGAGFSRIDIDHFSLPAPVVAPHIAGIAYKD